MTKDLKTTNGGNELALSADFIGKLQAGIAESRSTTLIAGGGKLLLRMLKSGEWVYGPSDEEVDKGSRWVVNLMTLSHGWCCWVETGANAKNELRGEVMASMSEPKPPRPQPIADTEFSEQRSFELKALDGGDQGVEVLYKSGSIGGMRAIDGLLAEIQRRLAEDPHHAFPVLELDHDSYNHTKWGRIFTPVLEVVGWADINGRLVGEPEPEAALPESLTKATRPRTRTVKPPADPVPPRSTTQAHAAQRRRPGA